MRLHMWCSFDYLTWRFSGVKMLLSVLGVRYPLCRGKEYRYLFDRGFMIGLQ